MASNFDFLTRYWPDLAQIGGTAECYLYSDPNACIYKLGMFGERVVDEMFKFDHIPEPEDSRQANKVRILKHEGLIPKNIDDILYALRKTRNNAVHAGLNSLDDAKTLLRMTYNLSLWFMEVYGDWGYIAKDFVMPENQSKQKDYDRLLEQQEAKIAELTAKITKIQTAAPNVTIAEREKKATAVSDNLNLSEAETRYIIDAQLRKVGWEADTVNLRYSKGTRPQKDKNLAIAEWPTDSQVGSYGYVDYALFVGLKLVGLVEAKKAMLDIPSVIDGQCKDYANNIRQQDLEYCVGHWGNYSIPFVFATNGRKYLKQLETKSGIWFLDLREGSNLPQALQGWMSPDGMMELLEENIEAANAKLQDTPDDFMRDPDGLNLYDYQMDAVETVEEKIRDGQRSILISMATGTGKTRVAIALIYRLVTANRFRRVLFLVDRNSLGTQAQDKLQEYKIEDLKNFYQLYNVKELDEQQIDKETKLHIATVQGLVKRIFYSDNDTIPAVTDYDLIVVDEAHRGYVLDREMSDDEQLYRNQDDYISKYRAVIEYFDAVKIGLTATPALQTTQIFGRPVFTYSYREAVIDGYLIDHDAPHDIHTKLRDNGIHYNRGENMTIYDPSTGGLTVSPELEDEMDFDIETFNRRIITENFNRTALTEISQYIDPEGPGKTLIYAVNDVHADLIVKILREIYKPYGIGNDAIMKITGSIEGGNQKKIESVIRRYKNEKYPNIAVTVDLLTTGVDVPQITSLIFLRRVKSRILFEQMLGRATRLCPEIGKTHFEVFDPVGTYESLQDVTAMKPVVTNPSTTFSELLEQLEKQTAERLVSQIIDEIAAKIQRGRRQMRKKNVEQFALKAEGMSPAEFVKKLRNLSEPAGSSLDQPNGSIPSTKKSFVLQHKEALVGFDKMPHDVSPIIIDYHADQLVSHTRGYGNGQKPEDYIESFKKFINSNMNMDAALKTVCTRPTELTRQSLRSLRLKLEDHGFTETELNSAMKELTNQDIAADIISIIRQQALGSPLVSHETRIRAAIAKLRQNHHFTAMQNNWLSRIEKNLLAESVIDEETFNTGAFKSSGGFSRVNKQFDGNLKSIIIELNTYLYDDGGKTA